jgi:hypothetical protein
MKKEGICHLNKLIMYPEVIKVIPKQPSFLELYFSNQEIKLLDVSKYWSSIFF